MKWPSTCPPDTARLRSQLLPLVVSELEGVVVPCNVDLRFITYTNPPMDETMIHESASVKDERLQSFHILSCWNRSGHFHIDTLHVDCRDRKITKGRVSREKSVQFGSSVAIPGLIVNEDLNVWTEVRGESKDKRDGYDE